MLKNARITHLKCMNRNNPLCIDECAPLFSWLFESDEKGFVQTAYRIVAATKESLLDTVPDLWDSGKVSSGECAWIAYEGKALISRQDCYWRVMAWDQQDKPLAWSETGKWKMGLLNHEDWEAYWISYKEKNIPEFNSTVPYYVGDDFKKGKNELYLTPVPYLVKDFNIDKKIRRAIAYASALGLYQLRLNGQQVGNDYFTPGWTEYDKRVYYQAYDVTSMITLGNNKVGVMLSDGWYAGYVGLVSRNQWGNTAKTIVQIEIEYEDGSTQKVTSSQDWKAAYGPIEEADLLHGETYNACKEIENWDKPGCTFENWHPADIHTDVTTALSAHRGAHTGIRRKIEPVSMAKCHDGSYIIDFGVNFTGFVSLKNITEVRGTRVVIDHAEVLHDDGSLNKDSYRSARARDSYVCSGEKIEAYEPIFTFRAFRYAQITGLTSLEMQDVNGVFVGSLLEDTGFFETSESLVNDIYQMMRNTIQCAYLDVPMDCCGRDERLGWGYDPCYSFRSSTYLFDAYDFAMKWYTDIADEQKENGCYNPVAPAIKMPDVELFDGESHVDCGLQMPWMIYKMYGNPKVFSDNYENMKRYFAYLERNNDRGLRIYLNADWLAILPHGYTDYVHGWSDTSRELIGTAFFAYNAFILCEAAKVLGRKEDEIYYADWYGKIKKAFQKFFEVRGDRMRQFAQGDMAIALYFKMLSENVRTNASLELCSDIKNKNYSLTTGVTSTTYVFDALSESGCHEVALNVLLNEEYPGYGYMLKNGATSCWERWDAFHHIRGTHPHPMNGYNHIGLSCMTAWFYRKMAGIEPLEPGFKKIRIKPYIEGAVRQVRSSYKCVYGLIMVEWEKTNDAVLLKVSIPANTQAEIHVPNLGYTNADDTTLSMCSNQDGRSVYKVGSGNYVFTSKKCLSVNR